MSFSSQLVLVAEKIPIKKSYIMKEASRIPSVRLEGFRYGIKRKKYALETLGGVGGPLKMILGCRYGTLEGSHCPRATRPSQL